MRVIHSGDGYKYLLKSVAAGDGCRNLSTPLTRYYHATGTPPGFWLGAAVSHFGAGELAAGDAVSEEQLARLLGAGRDPVTGEALGRAYPEFTSLQERIAARVEKLDPGLSPDERDIAVAEIEAEETARGNRRAVAGHDFTFSVPKSVSALWALADAGTQAAITEAHHAAVRDVLGLIEREVAATRTGMLGPRGGAVAQVDVTGLIATAFDHYDSRAGDPQLHTHVVISNKVKTAGDGRWRALDGTPVHAAVVGVSEYYNTILADRLTQLLGVGWEQRERGRDRNPSWEITGVPEPPIHAFSSRSAQIDAETDRLVDAYVGAHGHRPSKATIVKLRAQAALATRPDKEIRSLAVLTGEWRRRATRVLGLDVGDWATGLLAAAREPADPVVQDNEVDDAPSPEELERLGRRVVEAVEARRSTWQRWNLWAEASRLTMDRRCATVEEREAVVTAVTDAAENTSIRLTSPELATSPAAFRREDGTSVFRPRHGAVFTSEHLVAAEQRMLDLTHTATGPVVLDTTLDRTVRPPVDGRRLSPEQASALRQVSGSGRVLDVLVGAAGAGKTATMAALRRAWQSDHGAGSVVGLATSARAAEVLAADLGVGCENTAKWLFDHRHGRWDLRAGQLVIVDEASLADTPTLDAITAHAAEVGAKVLLVGDPMQLSSVGAGGGFGLLVRDLRTAPVDQGGGVAELLDVRRFHHAWEKHASLLLRRGDTSVIDTYLEHGRLVDGTTEGTLDAAYAAWRADLDAGRSSLMLAETLETVADLNTRARLDRITRGEVDPTHGAVLLHDDTEASVGDLVVTRKNNRRLHAGGVRGGWVKNGDTWTIQEIADDGSVVLARAGSRRSRVRVPAEYVAQDLELAYASTIHRAQGMTVDTAHALVHSAQMTREAIYVAMTRGRSANTAYVALDQAQLEPHQQVPTGEITLQSMLHGVLHHEGAELSALETLRDEQEHWSSIAQLVAEYNTLATTAQYERWTDAVHQSGLTPDQAESVVDSDAFGPLCAELRHAEADGYVPRVLLADVVAQRRRLGDADDLAAILHKRVRSFLDRQRQRPGHDNRTLRTRQSGDQRLPRLVAGLVPEATSPMDSDMGTALRERAILIEQRAHALAHQAIQERATWVTEIGRPPRDPKQRRVWLDSVATIAAYHDLYGDASGTDRGQQPDDTIKQRDLGRVRAAAAAARRVADPEPYRDHGRRPLKRHGPAGQDLGRR